LLPFRPLTLGVVRWRTMPSVCRYYAVASQVTETGPEHAKIFPHRCQAAEQIRRLRLQHHCARRDLASRSRNCSCASEAGPTHGFWRLAHSRAGAVDPLLVLSRRVAEATSFRGNVPTLSAAGFEFRMRYWRVWNTLDPAQLSVSTPPLHSPPRRRFFFTLTLYLPVSSGRWRSLFSPGSRRGSPRVAGLVKTSVSSLPPPALGARYAL